MTLTLPKSQCFITFFILFIIPCYQSLPIPHAPTTTTTIPAFPEQADDVAACPLTLSQQHFDGIKNACSSNILLHRTRCCPLLAAWLYSAYSATALAVHAHHTTTSYDMPLLPDDSETCETHLGKAFKLRGIQLFQPNHTCDLVYCYCGIRLHPFTCSHSFKLDPHTGNLVGDQSVKTLETNCLSSTKNGFPGLDGCSKCLHSLYSLRNKSSNSSKSGDRTAKIHDKDCELMGLTWLLAKNRTAYIHTVTWVLRALMLNPEGSDPKSCTLNSDGMPLAVDSSEMYDQSSSIKLLSPIFLSLLFPYFVLVIMHFILLST